MYISKYIYINTHTFLNTVYIYTYIFLSTEIHLAQSISCCFDICFESLLNVILNFHIKFKSTIDFVFKDS